MKIAVITRLETDDVGTFGRLTATNGAMFECYTGELPDRGNAPSLGRIPAGVYMCRWGQSPSRKNADGSPEWTFRLEGVKDRAGVLIHAGNFCGDKTKGYATDVEGCLILGRAILDIEIPDAKRAHQSWIAVDRKKQKGVSSSRDTIAAFVEFMGKDPFELTII